MGKKKGKKGKGKGGNSGEKLQPREALLAYQIQQMEKANNETEQQIELLTLEKDRLSKQSEAIDIQKKDRIKSLIHDDRKQESDAIHEKEVTSNEVYEKRCDQVALNKKLDENIDSVIKNISEIESQIEYKNQKSKARKNFYKTEYIELQDKVKLLEKRLSEMILQFDEMKQNLENQVEAARLQQDEKSTSSLEKQRLNAIQYAIKRLPPQQSQELKENRWLLSEAVVHREQIKVLYNQVEILEKRNLDLMNVVYTKRMNRLGMLMKSSNMDVDQDLLCKSIIVENLKDLNKLKNSSSCDLLKRSSYNDKNPDLNFSLHPSEIDLDLTNFKNIADADNFPHSVKNFDEKILKPNKLTLKPTQSTDMMNKIAGLLVQGEKIDDSNVDNSNKLEQEVFSMAKMSETLNASLLTTGVSKQNVLKKNENIEVPLETTSDENLSVWPITAEKLRCVGEIME